MQIVLAFEMILFGFGRCQNIRGNKQKSITKQHKKKQNFFQAFILPLMESHVTRFVPLPRQRLLRFHDVVMIMQLLPVWKRNCDAVMAEGFCKLMEVDVYGFTNTNATDRETG